MSNKLDSTNFDLFWDHKSKTWLPKKLNLTKVPMKYRCPTCGGILVKLEDRNFFDQYPQWGILNLIGGVCKKCWLDGKGKYGHSLLARMLRKELLAQELEGATEGVKQTTLF